MVFQQRRRIIELCTLVLSCPMRNLSRSDTGQAEKRHENHQQPSQGLCEGSKYVAVLIEFMD